MPKRSRHVNLEEELWSRVDADAAGRRQTLAAWIEEAAERKLAAPPEDRIPLPPPAPGSQVRARQVGRQVSGSARVLGDAAPDEVEPRFKGSR